MCACEYTYIESEREEWRKEKEKERKKKKKRDKDGRIAFSLSIVHFVCANIRARHLFEIVARVIRTSERFAPLFERGGATGDVSATERSIRAFN